MRIVIDGNIGSGKYTQLGLLEQAGFKVKREPIEKWPLDLFYNDPERWGLTFQLIVLYTLTPTEDFIHERCSLTSKEVFWNLMKKSEHEDYVYNKCYETHGWEPDLYIFLDTHPIDCYSHILKRDQEGDTMVTLDYLRQLQKRYEVLWNKLSCPKFRIDGSQSVEKIHKDLVNILKKR